MYAGNERDRDRALVSTAERYLGSSQERPALLEDGFRAAVRLYRHYEGVVKAGWEKLASPGTDDRSAVLMCVAAAADELSKALGGLADEEGLLARIRIVTEGGLGITFTPSEAYGRLDVCVHGRSGMQDSGLVSVCTSSAEVAALLQHLEKEVRESLVEERAAGGT